MKPMPSLPTASGRAGTCAACPLRQTLCWALAGCGPGAASATTYLLLGGEYFFSIPLWAVAVFYPGFLAGFMVNGWGLSEPASKVVGVLAVGFDYATLAALTRFAWFAFKYRRQSIAVRPSSQ